jgi:hypothetical protein
MVNSRGVARLGMLAVGLGIGAAVASTPGVARADDFQISIDGMDLFPTVGNTATAFSGSGDIAIAFGNGASASAVGGTGDFALASGSGADALAGGVTSDTGADNDTAIDIGNNTSPNNAEGAWAGNSDLAGATDGGTGSGDTAIDIGNNSGLEDGAFAGAGGVSLLSGNGNGDTAIDVGNNSFTEDFAVAAGGNDNYANISGDNSSALASIGNNNIAEIDGSLGEAITGGGYGPVPGDNDIAYIFDPFGTHGSTALAGVNLIPGVNGSSDLSAVFGDGLTSNSAVGADHLFDILSPFGDLPGSAAATSGGLLGELLSLF